jgi:signal transduction histidine kinase
LKTLWCCSQPLADQKAPLCATTRCRAFAAIDADRIKRVFWNLLEKPCRRDGTGNDHGFGALRRRFLRIGVRDTGPGIPPSLTEKSLSRFNRALKAAPAWDWPSCIRSCRLTAPKSL